MGFGRGVLDRIAGGLVLRRLLGEVTRLREGIDQQNAFLARLADKFAPAAPVVQAQELADTGLSYVSGAEQARVDHLRDVARHAGRPDPSDEEIDALLREEEFLGGAMGRTGR